MPTFLVTDPVFLGYESPDHPDSPRRLRGILDDLEHRPLWKEVSPLPARPVTREELLAVHSPAMVDSVEKACGSGYGFIDADTPVAPETLAAARSAAGGVLQAIDAVVREGGNAFCLVRPPGHHAGPDQAMAFCLFNNVAVGARYAQRRHGCARVAIIDWDIHHGNGTQDIFYPDGSIFYLSLHRSPYFPETGRSDETGTGPGAGCTLNIPLPFRISREEYLAAFRRGLAAVEAFRPDFVLVSAGFDAHRQDPIGGWCLESGDFAALTRAVTDLADRCCRGRVVSVLEGGYHPDALPASIAAHLEALRKALPAA